MLMTINDLAERLNLSLPQAKRTVIECEVEAIRLDNHPTRVNWQRMRFDPEVVERFILSRRRVFGDAARRPNPPARVPRLRSKGRLGPKREKTPRRDVSLN